MFRSLSAVPALHSYRNPIVPLVQGLFFEEDFFSHSTIPVLSVPANGTVAGTALSLALTLTKREIIFAGLDFCSSDISSHVKPHGFDSLIRDTADRLSPYYSRVFERAFSAFPFFDGEKKYSQLSVSQDVYRMVQDLHAQLRQSVQIQSDRN